MVTTLNLIWLAVVFAAFWAVVRLEHRQASTRAARSQRLVSVLLVTVSLFPCVSASDDVINFAYVSAGLETRSGFGHSVPENSNSNTVIYLVLQNLEHLQVSGFYTLSVVLLFLGLVFCWVPRSVLRQVLPSVSRGPPQISF